MSTINNYYANFSNMSIAEYAQKYFYSNQQEMDRIRKTIQIFPNDVSSVLDIGAGLGILLEELELMRGIKGIGIEIVDSKVEYARGKGIDMRKGDASKLNFSDKSFDLVVACEVLEHLPFGVFEAALGELVRVSRKYIVISVPFDEKRNFVRCPYCRASVNPDYHLREFRLETMKHLLPGAQLIQTRFIGTTVTPLFSNILNIRKHNLWPYFLVCPSCGYRKDQSNSNNKTETNLIPKQLIKRALTLLGRRKPKWILGLYAVR